MSIPDYQTCMLPLLKLAAGGSEHSTHEAIESLAEHFNLNDVEVAALLPSGTQPIFANRVGWARTYLKKAGLLEYPKRGFFKITSRGLDVLAGSTERINAAFLRQFPEFQEFVSASASDQETDLEIGFDERQTPEEQIEVAYSEIRTALASELLTKVKTASPGFFERLVVDLLLKMGYGGSRSDENSIRALFAKDLWEMHIEPSSIYRYVTDDSGIVVDVELERDGEGDKPVAERRRIEDELRRRGEEFRLLFELSAIGMAEVSPDGRYLRVNHKYSEMLGYSEHELLGLAVVDVTHPDDREATAAQVRSGFTSGDPAEYSIEKRYVRKDGAIIWALVNWTIVRDAVGRPLHSVANIQDITARKQAEAEREELLLRERAAREAAEAEVRSKDEFLAVVSHELRSPLHAILGYTTLLRHGDLDAQKIKKAVDVIELSGKAQAHLIDDLLDTARIISGKLRLIVGPVDMASVVDEAVQTVRPAAEAKGVSLQANLLPGIGQITGDHTRLQQIIWNLLSNAVKFTPQGGRVEVRLERMDPYIGIIVSDTGKGIASDFMPYVFDRFRQSDASSARRYGGLGLGLALVKYLVELHGGTIEAASAGEGHGATFKVTLPVRAVATPIGEPEGHNFRFLRA